MAQGVKLSLEQLARAQALHAGGQPWKCAAALIGCSREGLARAIAAQRRAATCHIATVAGPAPAGVDAMATLSAAPEAAHAPAPGDER